MAAQRGWETPAAAGGLIRRRTGWVTASHAKGLPREDWHADKLWLCPATGTAIEMRSLSFTTLKHDDSQQA